MSHELIVALHSEARRYCLERHDDWSRRYSAMSRAQQYDATARRYTEAARALFTRYLQLDAILVAIERLVPDDFATLDEARARLIAAAESARIPNPAVLDDPLASDVAEEEREAFAAHLAAVDEDILWRVVPLPFRRVLSPAESTAWLASFHGRFGRWYGGVPAMTRPPTHQTLPRSSLPRPVHVPLRRVVQSLVPAGTHLYELNEIGESYESAIEAVDFSGAEACWFPADLAWMVYVSHEDTLTLAGEPLVRAFQKPTP